MKTLYFIADAQNCIVSNVYESKENLLSEYSLDEDKGETLVEIQEGEDGYDELLKYI